MGDEDAAPKIAVSQVQALEEVQVKLPTRRAHPHQSRPRQRGDAGRD